MGGGGAVCAVAKGGICSPSVRISPFPLPNSETFGKLLKCVSIQFEHAVVFCKTDIISPDFTGCFTN